MCRIKVFVPCGTVPEQPLYQLLFRYTFFQFSAFPHFQKAVDGTFWPSGAA
jgi:hypothetical protein